MITEKKRQYHKRYQQNNKEKVNSWNKKCYRKNIERYREKKRKYYSENKDIINQKKIGYRKKHRKELSEYQRIYTNERRKKDAKFHLSEAFSGIIRQSLNGKKSGWHWEKLVGYTLEDLIKRLESNFNNKMTWDNYGSYWHIDHKKPKSLFKYKVAEDQAFKDCWCLANLQPLEKIANIKKSNKFF